MGQATPLIYVYGAGGHGKVVASAARRCGHEVLGFLDDDVAKQGGSVGGFAILALDAAALVRAGAHVALGVGDNRQRLSLFERLGALGLVAATIVHPTAELSDGARVGPGSYVGPHALLHTDASVGAACIVNSGAIVEHDVRIGDGVHVSPGAVIAGGVSVGDGALVGLGARVLPGLAIGAWSVVGAGAVVVDDVAAQAVVTGVPARVRASG